MRSLAVLLALVAVTAAFVLPEQSSVAECTMCELGVKAADPALAKDATTIENDFIKECEKVIPGKLGQHECKDYANKELGGIIKELQSGTAPKDVCTKLKMCTNMRSLTVLLALLAVAAAFVIPEQSNVAECTMCELGVKAADPALDKDVTAVENAFIKECEKVIPGKLGQHECKSFANKELGGIIKELESGTAPKDVCTKLKAC